MTSVQSYLDFSSHFDQPGFKAGFSLRSHEYDPFKDRQDLSKIIGLDPEALVIPIQTHSNHVIAVNEKGRIQDTDGIISTQKNLVLSIQVADCIPLFLLDKVNHSYGMVHAGWRGTAKGIVDTAINQLKSLGTSPLELMALIGPSIGPCCFEIGPEVARLFPEKYLKNRKGDRSLLNLSAVVRSQLMAQGLKNESIIHIDRCTHCDESFYSYRRQGPKAGRMIALSGWR